LDPEFRKQKLSYRGQRIYLSIEESIRNNMQFVAYSAAVADDVRTTPECTQTSPDQPDCLDKADHICYLFP